MPPLLKTVHEIPVSKQPLDHQRLLRWQLTRTEDFAAFSAALDNQNVELAHYKWASIWEDYLQTAAEEQQNWSQFTGRSTAKQQFAKPLVVRQSTQVQSDFERELWHLLGVLQGHRQGRAETTERVRMKGERLYTHICKRRSLSPLDWQSDELGADLEAALRAAIHDERKMSMDARMRSWKATLNVGMGMNSMARKMVRGPSPRLPVLRGKEADMACPLGQCAALDAAWSGLDAGDPDQPIHPHIWSSVKAAPCELRKIKASDIIEQLKRTKSGTSCGPDWWRIKELRALPTVAMSMLACLFNLIEECAYMPRAMMSGWLRPIPKEGFVSTPLAVRPISVLSLLHRTWSGVRFQHLQAWAAEILHPCQSAFRPGRSTRRELHTLLFQMNKCVAAKIPLYVGQIDLSKAFPRMNRTKAAALARASGLPHEFVQLIRTACLDKAMKWKISGTVMKATEQRRGTPQGCAISILLFQVLMAPVARHMSNLLAARCPLSRVLIYADDIIFMCTSEALLAECMTEATKLLTSLDFVVNINKSSVATIGAQRVPRVSIAGQSVPVREHPDLFGSTLTTSAVKLVAPNVIPTSSPSRTVQRWIKIKSRLSRLHSAPITYEGKSLLWRQLILPVMKYDPWVLLPTKGAADTWTGSAIRAIYSGIIGSKNKQLLAATNPHQVNVLCVLLHELAKVVFEEVQNDPLESFFLDEGALHGVPHSFDSLRQVGAHLWIACGPRGPCAHEHLCLCAVAAWIIGVISARNENVHEACLPQGVQDINGDTGPRCH
eukprot:1310945-Amphidinium_carterae.1